MLRAWNEPSAFCFLRNREALYCFYGGTAGGAGVDRRIADGGRMGAPGERCVAAHRSRRGSGAGRRIGQRKDDVVAGTDGSAPGRSPRDGGSMVGGGECLERRRDEWQKESADSKRKRTSERAWPRNGHGVSGADDLPQSGDAHWRAD